MSSEAAAADPTFAPNTFPNFNEYLSRYKASLEDPDTFWTQEANKYISWFSDFNKVSQGSFEDGDMAWFVDGKLNASHCCIDRHLEKKANEIAIIFEGDEVGSGRKITFKELHQGVCRIANAMLSKGVRKGDTVTVYMPMIPELAMTMLACARIGAVHSVVFAGFSAESLRDRIIYAQSKFVFTTDEGKRGGRTLPLKDIVNDACKGVDMVKHVFVFERTKCDISAGWVEGRDINMDKLVASQRPYCPCAVMDSEDLLFILFTSGSTGTPKGVAHSTAGYMLYAGMTCKESFDLREGDIHACVADCGWITGHSYIVYGPLCSGVTTVMFESTPMYPDYGRYWDLVERHRVTSFYTAPTAIRALMAKGDDFVTKYDRSSLRTLGTVGEPINPEAWNWYHNVIGNGKCNVVDTYWQTETGGHLMAPLPGKATAKPGSCCFPYYGIEPIMVDAASGEEIVGNDVEGVLCIKRAWPGIARTCFNDHERFMKTYLEPYKGLFFTGDGCRRDKDGYYWITGRVDDVLNCSGHRLGTAEIEAAICTSDLCAESAVVGFPHDIKGQGICCYVILATDVTETDEVLKALKTQVRSTIGAFATPDLIVVIPGLPKTRSGKVMRRILRKVVAGEEDSLGDVSTLADPSVVEAIINKMKAVQGR
jgi:acetyl-CoA synthetase